MSSDDRIYDLWRWNFDSGNWVFITTGSRDECKSASAGSYDEIRPALTGPPAEGPHMHDVTYVDGCTRCAAQRAETEAEDQRIRDYNVIRQVTQLCLNIKYGGKAVAQARAAVDELTGPLYDVELAEGTSGTDLAAELEAAARHLRNAARITDARKALDPQAGVLGAAESLADLLV